jgi:hypothetical protein
VFHNAVAISYREPAMGAVLRAGKGMYLPPAAAAAEDRPPTLAMDASIPPTDSPTYADGVLALAGASGIALLVPVVVLAIGTPIALTLRAVLEVASWLGALIAG